MNLLRLRWVLREGRRRWIQILGISLTLGIGVASYAGPLSVIEWRFEATEQSLELTNAYDLRATLSGGEEVPTGALARIAQSIDGIEDFSERLVIDTQIVTTIDNTELLVQGRVIGIEENPDGPRVNRVEVVRGEGMPRSGEEGGVPRVLLEEKFARFHGLSESGTLFVGSDTTVEYVGHGTSPEYFLIIEGGGSLGQSNFAVIFAPLSSAQAITNRTNVVNDLVVTLQPDADIEEVRQQLIDAAVSNIGTSFDTVTRDETPSFNGLQNAPQIDQDINLAFALLFLFGAGFAVLNFSGRMVQAQRREFGASMAIGEPPKSIATRPILIGLQIGVVGVILGVGLSFVLANQVVAVVEAAYTYPVFERQFQWGINAQAAAVGFLVPVLAVLTTVLRAVRVRPVEAIRSSHLASRGGALGPIIRRIPLPKGSLARMPFRNLLRAPRRTVMTLLTFALSLAILFAAVGFNSSFATTFDRGNQELLRNEPERFMAHFDSFVPVKSAEVRRVLEHPTVELGEAGLAVNARLTPATRTANSDDQNQLDVMVRFVDYDSNVWTPTTTKGSLSAGTTGITLAAKAASDLDVGVGDELRVTHPKMTPEALTYETRSLTVTAIHPHPLRINAYMDLSQASTWGLGGVANVVTGVPADGSNLNDVKRSLAGDDSSVARVQGLDESFESIEIALEQAENLTVSARYLVLVLLLLIAFNSTNINVEERSRDHATLFAYGIPVKRVIANLSAEGVLLCMAAILLGIALGYPLLLWIVLVLMPTAAPEIGPIVSINPLEMAVYFAIALAVVALAPVFSGRKLKNMFIPGKLRVME